MDCERLSESFVFKQGLLHYIVRKLIKILLFKSDKLENPSLSIYIPLFEHIKGQTESPLLTLVSPPLTPEGLLMGLLLTIIVFIVGCVYYGST